MSKNVYGIDYNAKIFASGKLHAKSFGDVVGLIIAKG
jgi:hypothetical protein